MWERISVFIPYLITAAALTFALTGLMRFVSRRFGIVSQPRERDIHTKPTPRLGGVAMILAFIAVFAVAQMLSPGILWFSDELRLGLDRQALGLMAGIAVLLLFGIWDDVRSLTPRQQLFGQFLAASCIIATGIGVDFITNPFGPPGSIISLQQVTIPLFPLGTHIATITLWSDLFTLVWLIAVMNIMNWFDGLDGLAGGVSLIAALLLATLSVMVGSPVGIIAMLVILFGVLAGFLPWNWYPAKIFMGTAGSTFLGFVLGVTAIISGGKVATVLLVLGVPVLDALWVIMTRLARHRPIAVADRNHIHHRLIDAGLSVPLAVLVLYLLAALFGGMALLYNDSAMKLWLAAVLVVTVGVLSLGTHTVKYKRRG